MNKSFRNSLKEIATGLFGADQKSLRRNIIQVGSALASAYTEGQAEMYRNASIPVKYLAVQVAPQFITVNDAAVMDDLRRAITASTVGQDAVCNGLRLGLLKEYLPGGQQLIQLLKVRMETTTDLVVVYPAEFVIAEKNEYVGLPEMPVSWWADALTA